VLFERKPCGDAIALLAEQGEARGDTVSKRDADGLAIQGQFELTLQQFFCF
jgi:hypothetical protein